MPDMFGNPTEEEKWAMAIRSGQASPMSSGMRAPTAEQLAAMNPDFSQDELAISQQQDYAKQMRGQMGDRLEGRTVGPSNIYVGPSWGDMLASVGEGFLAGRADKKAGAKATELGEKRDAAALAKARNAVFEREREAGRYQEGIDLQRQGMDQSAQQAAANLAVDQGVLDVKRETEARQQAAAAATEAARAETLRQQGLDRDYATLQAGQDDIEGGLQRTRARAEKFEDRRRADEKLQREFELGEEAADADLDREKELAEWEASLEGDGILKTDLNHGEDFARAVSDLGSATERKKARMLRQTGDSLAETIQLAAQYRAENPEIDWASPKADWVSEKAGLVPFVGGEALRNITKGVVYNEKEQTLRGMMANGVESFRRARTGANLTGIEKILGEDWDPTAPGIGAEESLRRAVELNSYIENELGVMGVPSYGLSGRRTPSTKEDIPVVGDDGSVSYPQGGIVTASGVELKPFAELTEEEIDSLTEEELDAYGG